MKFYKIVILLVLFASCNKQNKKICYWNNGVKAIEYSYLKLNKYDTITTVDPVSGNYYYDIIQTFEDIKNGDFKEWDFQGRLIMKGQYEKNLKVGIWTAYDTIGSIESEITFNVFHGTDLAIGRATYYFKNGKIKSKGYYKADIVNTNNKKNIRSFKDGLWLNYDTIGNLLDSVFYFHDTIIKSNK